MFNTGNCASVPLVANIDGSGIIKLRGITNQCKARFLVSYSGNIQIPTGGTVGEISLAIAVDGEPMSGNNGMSTGTHDAREGRAGMSRRSYMETKEMHNGNSPEDKDAKMKELEKYMKSLSEDVTELFSGMSPEEKQLTKTKLTTLVTKM